MDSYVTIHTEVYLDGRNITNNLEELNDLQGEIVYLSSHEETPKRKIMQKIVYGKPVRFLEVLNKGNMGITTFKNYIVKCEELRIEDVEYKDGINSVLKDIKVKEDNFESVYDLLSSLRVKRLDICTGLGELEGSFDRRVRGTMLSTIEEYGKTNRTMATKINTPIVDKERMMEELNQKLNEMFGIYEN